MTNQDYGFGLKEKQKNDGIWVDYLDKFVRVCGLQGNLVVIGKLLETYFDRSMFFPYSTSRGTSLEDNYVLIDQGDPRTIRSEIISDMEVIPQEYFDKILNDNQKINEFKQKKLKLDNLETEIKIIELEQRLILLKNGKQ